MSRACDAAVEEAFSVTEGGEPWALAMVIGQRAAGRVLARFGTVAEMARAADTELIAAGLPASTVSRFRAAVQLGRASLADLAKGRRLPDAGAVALHFRATIGSEPVEVFHALAMDVRHRVIRDVLVARGSLIGVEVHPRDTFRELIRLGAASVIFCHNHPSGDPTPSRQDVELTARLREVGEVCGISVLDHVVVTATSHVSMAERGWLWA